MGMGGCIAFYGSGLMKSIIITLQLFRAMTLSMPWLVYGSYDIYIFIGMEVVSIDIPGNQGWELHGGEL